MTVRMILKPEIKVLEGEDGEIRLQTPLYDVPLPGWSGGARDVLYKMTAEGASDDDMKTIIIGAEGPQGFFKFMGQYAKLRAYAVVCNALYDGEERFATIVPLTTNYRAASDDLAADQLFSLSRFAAIHREDDTLILECPLGHARVLLHHHLAAAVLGVLAQPTSLDGLGEIFGNLEAETLKKFVSFLHSAGALTLVGEDGTRAEDSDTSLITWDFHDMLFHTRVRYGRYDRPFVGELHHVDAMEMPPPVKPISSENPIHLKSPDLDALKLSDPPLIEVSENRKTLYDYAETPINADQIGEFLYRVCRVKHTFLETYNSPSGIQYPMTFAFRPYPSGGGLFEIEFYVNVRQCEGLEGGIYHYNPVEHQLALVAEENGNTRALLADAKNAMQHGQEPQVLITYAARFARLAWKYNTLAYSLIQKHVGVLYHSMYLHATAMNLAPCAIGAGNSDLFAQATGLPYFEEGSVGDFALSSKA